ncbi:MAG: V-type ATP synthase subunit I [Dysosmobacter sp.]|uniref:V-type ATP synthase subunit I n=1 Tax=uncultured Oscillibacter sp. TaxID=876091 RepID=UPI00261FE320|nr:V-type ATP synthase subunit I [uncultured Oscillibacter sp.]MCX4372556.1 V-type ATP synthase subunit I [Dysosmobacter sp.]
MAIVKMKKLRVIAMAGRREELLEGLLRLGCVEISEPDGKEQEWSALMRRGQSRLLSAKEDITQAGTALAALKKYAQSKDGLFIQRRPVSEAEFLGGKTVEKARAVSRDIGEQLQALTRLQNEESRLLARQASLQPWRSLDMPLELEGTASVLFRMGVCPGGADTGAIKTELAAADAAAELYELSADKQQNYYLLVCHRADESAVMELLRPHAFSVVSFQGLTGTAAENLQNLERQLEENHGAQARAAEAIAALGGEKELLQLYTDRLRAEEAREVNAERMLTDGTILFFEGWAPAERMGDVQSLLEKLGCAWEASDPTEEEIPEVPVQLKNNWLTRPLNMVTEMYSLPAYNNVDPNPLMAPFFILFYGIMMADMGYGLLMFLAGTIISRKYRPKGTMGHMMGLMQLCGVSTFIMGAITGGFFGDFLTQVVKLTTGGDFALPALFTPLNDTLMILVGAIALGGVHIVTGMAVSFIRKLKAGAVLDAIFEEATWWIVFAGIGLMAAGVTNIVLYAGLALVVIGPLVTGQGFGKIMGIFGSLYNHVTGFFGDFLSYARLMALMLAGSVIAQVFNTLGAIPNNIIIFLIISLAGNALNFALNLLGCYVHDLRLQCLEYFGKFYEDGGRPFRPLAMETKYVDITK